MTKVQLQPGMVVDGFIVRELIHKGGMAHLWKVNEEGSDKPLLMKVPILHEGEDPAAIVGFEMEQMIMPRLSGRHVPAFVASGDFVSEPFIVMEYLEGTSLLPKLEELPLPVGEVVALGARIASALDSLHHQRVVHLDIKPSNIMSRPTGEIVLIDYGLSRHLDLPDLMAEEFRLPYGTAPYMAPEQVLGIRHDTRSDIFSLGVLLYFFATGERPFGDPQRLNGLKKRLWNDPEPPRALNAEIPGWFQEIVLRCLEVNAARRYPTSAQLTFDLQNPESIVTTDRAEKIRRDSFFLRLRRKSEPLGSLIDHPADTIAGLAHAPIVAVAVDFSTASPELLQALRDTVMRTLDRAKDSRVACLNVLKQSRVAIDSTLDEKGESKHINLLVRLKDWARQMSVEPGRVSFHVLENVDVAEALLEYARINNVDHIVMGARENSTARKLLGSISGKVAAEAPCTVSVVRIRRQDDQAE